jgi:hypothetical protein
VRRSRGGAAAKGGSDPGGEPQKMIELLIFSLFVIVGLCLLVALPVMLVGMALKLLFGLVLLPFRVLGAVFGALAGVLGGLFKGLFAVFAVLVGIVIVPLLILALPIGILLLIVLAVAGVVKLLTGTAFAAA